MTRLRHPLVLFGIALYVFPYVVVALGKSTFNASEFLLWAIFAVGINLLWGHTGDLSFGHGMFFGWGAYSAGLMSRRIAFVPLDLLVGAAVAMAVAYPLAKIIVRRATGIYFAMITLAIGEMFYFIAIRLTSITGGENGLGDIHLGKLFWIDLTSRVNFFYLTAWTAFITIAVAWFIVRSPYGRVCRAIQQNRARVPFLGFDTVAYRERAFVISAGICGIAGGLSAFLFRHVAADTVRWTNTGAAVLIAMVGGVQSFFGPAAAAAIIVRAEDAHRYTDKPIYVKGLAFAAGPAEGPMSPEYDYTTFTEVVRSAQDAYAQAGITNPRAELAMAEVHDCFTPTELVLMEDLGFAERGFGWKEVLAGTYDLDGELAVNPDGGLKSFGHPIGASGLRMLFEAWLQLRQEAPPERAIKSVSEGGRKLALTHNLGGAPGECVSFVSIVGSEPSA